MGLGNIGGRYAISRHNVGFMFLDELASKHSANFDESSKLKCLIARHDGVVLAKPTTMMNSSGLSVSFVKEFYKVDIDNTFVVHDDLDIKLGEFKIQKGKGPKLHNGIESIEFKLGDKNFWRVRIGIDNRKREDRIPGEDYVLQNFSLDELEKVVEVFGRVREEVNL